MDSTTVLRNAIIEALSDQLPFTGIARILWIDGNTALTTLITIEKTPRKPWVVASEDLLMWLQRGEARRSQFRLPAYMLRVEDDIAAGERELRDRNWERIAGLTDRPVPGEIFEERSMGALVALHAEATGTQRKTLYRLLYRYWTFGQIRNALLPNYENVGAPGKDRSIHCRKAPRTSAPESGGAQRAMREGPR